MPSIYKAVTVKYRSMKKYWLQTIATSSFLIIVTTVIFLYTSGYRLLKEENVNVDFRRTGMISAKSLPEGANVYLNGVLKTASNDTIQALDPGIYQLRISRNGFVTWEKDVEVFAELVTDITAVLISQSPRLEPLTNTGARMPVISPTLSKLAYFSKDGSESGVWIIPLTNTGLSLFRAEPYVAIEDTFNTMFSSGKSIEWSPDEKELLVQGPNDIYYVIDLNTKAVESTVSADPIREEWETLRLTKRNDFLAKIDIPEEMLRVAQAPETKWSPDEKKFMYKVAKEDNTVEYRVYNMEKPMPVGEKVDNLVFTLATDAPEPSITWYADSFHLILVDGNVEEEKSGSINLIRIDGTNKTEIYNNTMYSNNVYSSPVGDKLIFLTSFKSGEQTDLYTIGIR